MPDSADMPDPALLQERIRELEREKQELIDAADAFAHTLAICAVNPNWCRGNYKFDNVWMRGCNGYKPAQETLQKAEPVIERYLRRKG